MKRRHLARDVIRLCKEMRRRRPDTVFGADLIAGFPTETDRAHEATIRLIEEADLSHLHVFSYSDREGTPAAKMPKTKPSDIKRRALALREMGRKQLDKLVSLRVNKYDELLLEKSNQGYLRNFIRVKLAHDKLLPSGNILPVKILHSQSYGNDSPSVVVELL